MPLQDKYDTPIVADIHFQPTVALMCAEAFEKVRVNPGNFADGRKTFEEIDYDDPSQFEEERAHIEEVFTPLVLKCKELGTAMRIGTNHGSLSARILSYYGDTPAGAQLPLRAATRGQRASLRAVTFGSYAGRHSASPSLFAFDRLHRRVVAPRCLLQLRKR